MNAMRLLKTGLLAVVFALSASFAAANDYTYANGYYWQGSAAYTRAWVRLYDPRCGYYYGYQYTRAPYADQIKNVTPKVAGWKAAFLEVLKNRDAYVLGAKAQAAENEAFNRAVAALGSFEIEGYGQGLNSYGYGGANAYGASRNGYDNPYYQQVAQGSSLYGVTQATASINANVDINETMNHAARLSADQSRYASEGYGQFLGVVDKLNDTVVGAASVAAEIEAKSNAAAKLLAALQPAARSVTVKRETGDASDSVGAVATSGVIQKSCLTCHSGADAKKGFRLDQKLTIDQFGLAFDQVTAGTMPPADSGSQLTDADRGEVLMELFQLTK